MIGNSGSGKSTLAKALGERFGLPVYHLDKHLLSGNFEKLPHEEYMRVHAELIAGEDWVIDGNYRHAIPDRIKRATLVVFLDISRVIAVPRVFRRSRRGGHPADSIPAGAKPEQISWGFFKWTMGYSRRKVAQDLRELCQEAGVPLLVVKNQPVERLVAEVERVVLL